MIVLREGGVWRARQVQSVHVAEPKKNVSGTSHPRPKSLVLLTTVGVDKQSVLGLPGWVEHGRVVALLSTWGGWVGHHWD